MFDKKRKRHKEKFKAMDSACELQAARPASWLALSFVGERYFFFLVSNDYFFQGDLSGIHSFLYSLVAKELSSGEREGEVTQVTRARLTFIH